MSWSPRSNGYDLSRLTPYKYDLRRGCQRLYVGSEVKGGSGRALDKIGQGQLHAGSAGGGGGGDGAGRDRVDFQRGGR